MVMGRMWRCRGCDVWWGGCNDILQYGLAGGIKGVSFLAFVVPLVWGGIIFCAINESNGFQSLHSST